MTKVHNGFRSCLRAVEILVVVATHSGWYALKKVAAFASGRSQRADVEGQFLVGLFEKLGPTFIKFGQVLSSRADLLPGRIVEPLTRLQDHVRPFPWAQVSRTVAEEFGSDVDELFASFEVEPVAAASIAQVHRATLENGQKVAVKVRRPNIERMLECDLRIMRFFGSVVDRLPFCRTIPLSEVVRDVGEPVRDQLDFIKEAENNRQFHQLFAGAERVRFPALIEPLCGKTVLTMEYLERLTKLDSPDMDEEAKQVAALAGLRALYKMIFIHGFIHADMHPGNVFVREWGEFVFLDTGLIAVLSASDRRNFAEFFFGIVNNEGLRCAQIVYDDASYRAKSFDRERFDSAMVTLIGKYSALRSCEFEVTHFVYELINLQRKHRLRGSTKFMTTILAMVVYDGICKQLYPTCDFQRESRGYLIAARYGSSTPPAASGGRGSSDPASVLSKLS